MSDNSKRSDEKDKKDENNLGLSRNDTYPEELAREERQLVQNRRETARSGKSVSKGRLEGKAIGFACSGGGIRSATFCLGFFQGLARLRDRIHEPLHLLKHIDYLSTVSGGGYFGGFLGRLITRATAGDLSGIERAERDLENKSSEEVGWLRNHGRYISPTGAGDSLVAIAVFLRNWVTLHLVLGAGFLMLFLALNTLRASLWNLSWWQDLEGYFQASAARLWWSPWLVPVLALLVVALLPLGWAYWLAQRDPKTVRSRTPIIATVILVVTGIFLLDLADRYPLAEFEGWEVVVVPVFFLVAIGTALCLLPLFKKRKKGQLWFPATVLVVVGLETAFLCWLIGTEPFRRNLLGVHLMEGTFEARWVLLLFIAIAGVGVLTRLGLDLLGTRPREPQEPEPEDRPPEEETLEDPSRRQVSLLIRGLIVGAALFVLYLIYVLRGDRSLDALMTDIRGSGVAIAVAVLCVCAALALAYWALVMPYAIRRAAGESDPAPSARNHLSIWLSRALVLFVGVLALALIDSLGQSLWALLGAGGGKLVLAVLSSAVAGAAGFATVARTLADLMAGGGKSDAGRRFRVPWKLLATVASLVLWGSLIILYSTASHWVLWQGKGSLPKELGSTIGRAWESEAVEGVLRVDPDGSIKVGVAEAEPSLPADAARRRSDDRSDPLVEPLHQEVMLVIFLVGAGLVSLLSQNLRFINFSSHQGLYAARLVRAYLGASNPGRRRGDGRSVSRTLAKDDLPLHEYRPHDHGGPLHLLNVTINETIDGRSQIEQRDRKGLPMCVGPVGLSAGRRFHAKWSDEKRDEPADKLRIFWSRPDHPSARWVGIEPIDLPEKCDQEPEHPEEYRSCFHLFRSQADREAREEGARAPARLVERLTLGDWLSISGAAFSTGLGAKTSLGLSSLMAFINVRLGYWWNSGIDPLARDDYPANSPVSRISRAFVRFFPTHAYLLDEASARFHGPNRRNWYLSDGGHFENTGCYELLRRRVPMIVALDCGADPDYDFADLANLVRKARIDFGAEVEFFSQEEINKHVDPDINKYFGTPAQIRRHARELRDEAEDEIFHGRSYSRKHAALARVWFPGDPKSKPTTEILWIKPSMVGDEPIDLRNYHGNHPAFPQETTADQFFDEAQWESYRKLGEGIAKRLFYDDPRPEQSWTPLRWFQRKKNLHTFVNPQ